MNKTILSKESVGRGVLAVSLSMTLHFGMVSYDSNEKLDKSIKQLGEAQVALEQKESDYKELEQKFLSVESESQKLEKRQEELMSQFDKLKKEKETLSKNYEALKKIKADARKKALMQSSSSPASVKVSSASKSTGGYQNWKRMNVESTGYSLISDELGSDGSPSTATGTYPTAGRTIAVDPRVIPYGTKVYIPAFNNTFIAEDTGGAIKGNKIDIYFNHGNEARQWGRRTIEVYVQP